jgi:endonuclease YncB( thermonuclease family)
VLALSDHIGQRMVACELKETDRYGRVVAICRAGAEDLNAWLVAAGLGARLPPILDAAYVGQEAAAHTAGLGIWRGAFTAPWDWRHGQRTPMVTEKVTPPESAAACCGLPGCACDAQ